MSEEDQKTYTRLCNEKEAILDEIERWKEGTIFKNQRMGLWNNSTYFDELWYIHREIEKELTALKIVMRMKVYKHLSKNLPNDVILHITSFGEDVDEAAEYFISTGTNPTIDDVSQNN